MTKKGERTRKALLEICSQIISQEGLEALTYRRIAMRGGVSPGLVTRYFPKTTTIFPSVVEYVFQEVRRELDPPEGFSGEELLLRVVSINFDYFIHRKIHHHRIVLHSSLRADFEHEAAQEFYKVIVSSIERLRNYTRKMLAEKSLAATVQEIDDFSTGFLQQLTCALEHCSLLPKKERRRYGEEYLESQKRRIQEFTTYLTLRTVQLNGLES